jgi:predicted nucleic acid-binding protein
MIILDTNVLSELMRPVADESVTKWLSAQQSDNLQTTTVCQAEIMFGLALLPHGRRRVILTKSAEQLFAQDFAGRILPFDVAAAREYGDLRAKRQLSGRKIRTLDAQIAAIARSKKAVLVTRNIADFIDSDLELVNPWEA